MSKKKNRKRVDNPASKLVAHPKHPYHFGYSGGCKKVGFVTNNIGGNQTSYLLVNQVNKFLAHNFAISFCLFIKDVVPPATQPFFGTYQLRDAVTFDGTLIACNLDSALAMKNFTRAKRFWYVYDLEWKQVENRYSESVVKEVLGDTNIIKFTRSPLYRDVLQKSGCNVVDTIINDFDIPAILEVIK